MFKDLQLAKPNSQSINSSVRTRESPHLDFTDVLHHSLVADVDHEGQHGLISTLPHISVAILQSHEQVLCAGVNFLLVDTLCWC